MALAPGMEGENKRIHESTEMMLKSRPIDKSVMLFKRLLLSLSTKLVSQERNYLPLVSHSSRSLQKHPKNSTGISKIPWVL
jgi:hypothetical protein